MSKLNRFLLAAAIIGIATVAVAIHPQWGRGENLALLFVLLAALVAAGIFALRSCSAEGRSGRKNLSPSLATLSSAAILAVYAAGYHRTSAVSGGFTEQSNRRGAPVQIAASLAVPPPSAPQFEPDAEGSPTPKLATPPARIQSKNRLSKNSAATKSAAPETTNVLGTMYATAAPAAPQASVSSASSAASQDAAAAPEIAATTASVANVQFGAPNAPAPPPPQAKAAMYKDGTYYGWGSCRHGDIQASVTIQDGRIASAAITQCLTRYSCSWISALPGQVVKRQSPEVDYVSGASQSTDAFYGAIVSALSKAHF